MGRHPATAILGLLLALSVVPLRAHEASEDVDVLDPQATIAYSQAAVGRSLGDHGFLDQDGRPVRLSDFDGRPLVISLVYTSCAESCPILIERLADAVEVAREALGADSFSVVTVGFDSVHDQPARLKAYAATHGIDPSNWRFLSGDHTTVDALMKDLGFLSVASPRGFDHVAQISIVDPRRQVYAHVYGADFEVPALVDPLKALLFEDLAYIADLSDLIERVRLFCTFYDPGRGRYAFDYSFFIALTVGAATLLGLGTIIARAWLRHQRHPEGRA